MKIALIGAYGFTGSLIANELQLSKLAFTGYGRNLDKLNQLQSEFSFLKQVQAIDLRKVADVESIVSNSDLIINCAGPFTEEATLLLENIADSGKIYLDITGEIGFVRASREKFHARAQKSNSLIIHGCAFESLVADLGLAYVLDKLGSIKKVRTFYNFNQLKASPGTKMTMKLSKYRKILKVDNNDWSESNFQEDQLHITIDGDDEHIAIPYPLPEIAYSLWNFKALKAESFLLVGMREAKFFKGTSEASGNSLDTLDTIRQKKRKGPSAEDRAIQKSKLVLSVESDTNQVLQILLESSDMYLATAKAISLSVQKLLQISTRPNGVISPSQLFKDNIMAALNDLEVHLIENPDYIISNSIPPE